MGFLSLVKKSSSAAKERKRKDELSRAYFDDAYTRGLEKEYYDLLQKIEDEYKRLNQHGDFSGRAGAALITKCEKAIPIFMELVALWNRYEEPIPRCPLFARQAMIHEKRGEYERAAAVCMVAIRAGFSDDGTKGGMPARLKRILKKGNLTLAESVDP